MSKKNIFVMGLDEFNLNLMKEADHENNYEFHSLLNVQEVAGDPYFNVPALLKKAKNQLANFHGSIDAIVGYWDFPTVLMMPILRKEYGLSGPSLESVLQCEHKYWSRLSQKKIIPEHIPNFTLVDPSDQKALAKLDLPFPFWIKPVKAHSSMLGFRVNNQDEFNTIIAQIRSGIKQFSSPLNDLMGYADLPEEIREIHGGYCIAEEIISTDYQCTLEGYIFEDTFEIYGVVDSIREKNHSSFERYEYPSQLPEEAKQTMAELAQKVILQSGLQNSPFNIEFFYDPEKNIVNLLEINTRISKSHSPLFQKVDGVIHNKVMIDIALDQHPSLPSLKGPFKHAAKFMPRLYGDLDDAVITKAPSEKELREIERRFPETEIQLQVSKGMKFSELLYQDSYSYEWATIFMGANDHNTLIQQYEACKQALEIKWRMPDEE